MRGNETSIVLYKEEDGHSISNNVSLPSHSCGSSLPLSCDEGKTKLDGEENELGLSLRRIQSLRLWRTHRLE